MKNVLLNTWYAAGWGPQLLVGQMQSRVLLDEPVVLFRDPQGQPVALADRCAHRFAPLSMGKLCDGGASIECPYHGLRYDALGKCVYNPHGNGHVPRSAKVRSYPVVERQCVLWIWMGDPELADAAQIPDIEFLDPDNWAVASGHMLVEAHYELETDNILDLSHIEFLHPLFSSEAVRRGKIVCTQEGETVWSRRMITDDDPPDFIRKAFNIPLGSRVDRWLDVRWNVPAVMALWTGGVASGLPREQGVNWHSAHLFTPESDTRTHYFWALSFSRTLGAAAEELARENAPPIRQAFEQEDKPMIEAVQRRMRGQDLWSLNPVLLPGDAAAVRARRILQARIEAESRGTPASAAAASTTDH